MGIFLWWVAGSLRWHGLPGCSHSSRLQNAEMGRIFLTIAQPRARRRPIFWVATHRKHHQNTDKEGDPHSPRDGGFWAHMGWILTGKAMHNKRDSLLPYVPDLRKDKFHVWITEFP